MPIKSGPVGGAGELTAYIAKLQRRARVDCDPSNGSAVQQARGRAYSEVARELSALLIEESASFTAWYARRFPNGFEMDKSYLQEAWNAALAAKAPQGVPARERTALLWLKENIGPKLDYERAKTIIANALLPAPVSDDTIHHGMVPPADEYNLRASRVQGHWYVDIDIDKAHSGMANGFTLSEAIDNASEMLRHMRNTAIEEGRLPREAAAPKPDAGIDAVERAENKTCL